MVELYNDKVYESANPNPNVFKYKTPTVFSKGFYYLFERIVFKVNHFRFPCPNILERYL